jgi:hypothetical protein
MPFRLTDTQLHLVMHIAAQLELDSFLQRLSAALRIRAGLREPADLDIEVAVRLALKGLMQSPAA